MRSEKEVELTTDRLFEVLKMRKQLDSGEALVYFEDLQTEAQVCSGFLKVLKSQFISALLLYDSRYRGSPLTRAEFYDIMNFVNRVVLQKKTLPTLEPLNSAEPNPYDQITFLEQGPSKDQARIKKTRGDQTSEIGYSVRKRTKLVEEQCETKEKMIFRPTKVSSQQRQFLTKLLVQGRGYMLSVQQKRNMTEVFEFYLRKQNNYNFTHESQALSRAGFLNFCEDFGLVDFDFSVSDRARQLLLMGSSRFLRMRLSNMPVAQHSSRPRAWHPRNLTRNDLLSTLNQVSVNGGLTLEQFEIALRSIGKMVFLKRLAIQSQFEKIKLVPQKWLSLLVPLAQELFFLLIEMHDHAACRRKMRYEEEEVDEKSPKEVVKYKQILKEKEDEPQIRVFAQPVNKLSCDLKELFCSEIDLQRQIVKKTEREKVAKKKRIGEGVQESKGFKLRPRHLRLDDCLVISNSTSRLSQVLVVYVINGKEGKNESVLGRSKARISKHEISCEGMRIYRSISALSMGKVEVVDVIPLQKQRTKLKLSVQGSQQVGTGLM